MLLSSLAAAAEPADRPRAPRRWLGVLVAGLSLALAGCVEASGMAESAPGGSLAAGPAAPAGATPVVSDSPTGAGAYLAGRAAANAHDFGAAARYLSQALQQDPDNLELLRRTFVAMAGEGRRADMLQLAHRVTQREPLAVLANLVIALDDVRGGRLDAADTRLAELPRSGITNLVLPLVRGWIAAGRKDATSAAAALKPLSDSSAFATLHALHAALVADFAADRIAAAESYREAIDSAQNPPFRVVEIAGNFFERNGDVERARGLYDNFLKLNPDTLLLQTALARLKAGTKPAPVVRAVEDGLAEALFDVSSILQRERPASEFGLIYDRLSLQLKPDFPMAQMLLGDILESLKRETDAIAVYQTIAPDSPFRWSARLRVAASHDALGEVDGAIAELTQMASERPEREDALIRLGDLYRGHERWAESVGAYDNAIGRLPKVERRHWALLFSRAIALERSKDWKRAETDLEQALKLEPDQPYVLNYLGYTWIEQGVNLERARTMVERAVDLRPQDGHIVDSLGWLYYRTGDYEKAARMLERAVELRPQDATINDHLGDAYWLVGRRDEARFQWKRALSLGPEAELKAVVETKLKDGLVTPKTAARPDK
ncbi:MAG: tetratricopeptide repeat protein [Proteobacteria bacterium]|nr:tetratricopeptide repeat protein [Pseudomonadota bacterium]